MVTNCRGKRAVLAVRWKATPKGSAMHPLSLEARNPAQFLRCRENGP